MSEQKFAEFRERAEIVVTPADPDVLLKRGRALRRRRQVAPLMAVAAIAAIGFGIFASGGDDVGNEPQPIDTPSETSSPLANGAGDVPPGTWALDVIEDGQPDATVEMVGDGWNGFNTGASKSEADSAVSWGLGAYQDIIIDRCDPDRHATSRPGVVRQLNQIPGAVTVPPGSATAMGLTGTHLQLSIPVDVDCPSGAEPSGANLLAIWDGSDDPTVTVDVWLLEHEDGLLVLTKGVRGNPSVATVEELNQAVDSLRLLPRGAPAPDWLP